MSTITAVAPMLVDGHGENVTEEVRAIEYHDGKPFAVMTCEIRDDVARTGRHAADRYLSTAQQYDFEWCRTNRQLYYHQSGSGGSANEFHVGPFCKPSPPPAKLWLAPGVRAYEYTGKRLATGRRFVSTDRLLRMGYELIQEPLDLRRLTRERKGTLNPFDVAEGDTECHYCKFCNDYMPNNGWGDWLCDHVRWCDECGWWVYDKTHVRLDSHDGKPTVHSGDES